MRLTDFRTMVGGKWIRPLKRHAIYLRDGFRCLYCDRDLHGARPQEITLEHLRPVSRGGSNRSRNLITACSGCNFKRGILPYTRFADASAVKRIRRNVRRKLGRYLAMAKELRSQGRRFPERRAVA